MLDEAGGAFAVYTGGNLLLIPMSSDRNPKSNLQQVGRLTNSNADAFGDAPFAMPLGVIR
jgi:hypothetical protein